MSVICYILSRNRRKSEVMVRMTENEKRGRFEALYREHFRAMYLAASCALTAGGCRGGRGLAIISVPDKPDGTH